MIKFIEYLINKGYAYLDEQGNIHLKGEGGNTIKARKSLLVGPLYDYLHKRYKEEGIKYKFVEFDISILNSGDIFDVMLAKAVKVDTK